MVYICDAYSTNIKNGKHLNKGVCFLYKKQLKFIYTFKYFIKKLYDNSAKVNIASDKKAQQ